ncbi:MAG TPA: DUF3093 domain-containing protein [Jatrophihabitans sp.]
MIESPPVVAGTVHYTERLRTPWWWYPMAIVVAVLLGFEFALAVSGWIGWIPLIILLPVCVLIVWRFSSGRVRLIGSTVSAGDELLDLSQVSQAIGLSATELRRLVGRHADPTAFVFIRSWVGPGVQLVLQPGAAHGGDQHGEQDEQDEQSTEDVAEQSDPADIVPYWVVSTRHPDRLLASLAEQSVPVA